MPRPRRQQGALSTSSLMLRPVEETVEGRSLRRVSHEAGQLTLYGASGTLGRRPQASSGAQQEGGKKRRGGFQGPVATDGAIALLVHGWEGGRIYRREGRQVPSSKSSEA